MLTLEMLLVTAFGDVRQVDEMSRRIAGIHRVVHGSLPQDAGQWRRDTEYSATSPELCLWVYATIVETMLNSYSTFIRPLGLSERAELYRESEGSGGRGAVPRRRPVMPAVAFVVNRNRIRRFGRLNRRCAAVAAARGWDIEVLETRSAGAGDGATRQAVAAGAQLVFAVGGDGTVQACAQALAGSQVPLAIVPRGTANLVATALGIPASLEAALAVGFGPHERRIDLAVADGVTFAAMAGIGLDAAVVGATAAALKSTAGWLGYAMTGVRRLAGTRTRFQIRLDGGQAIDRQARCVVVGNVGLLPGGFVLLPEARPDDGLLDVGILAPAGPFGWPRVAWRVLSRSPHDDAVLERYQARRVEIAAGARLPRQADGELIGSAASLTVALAPGGLLVRVPPPAGAAKRRGRPRQPRQPRRPPAKRHGCRLLVGLSVRLPHPWRGGAGVAGPGAAGPGWRAGWRGGLGLRGRAG